MRQATMTTAVLFLFSNVFSQQCNNRTYPYAERIDFPETINGIKVQDPYRWMEDMQSSRVKKWVASQDSLLEEELHTMPSRAKIKARVRELNLFTRYGVPVKAKNRYFYIETPPNTSRPRLFMQESLNARPVLLIDSDRDNPLMQLFPIGNGGVFPDPGGKFLAYGLSNPASRWYSIHVMDLEEKKDIPGEVISGLNNLGGPIAWSKTGDGFFYVRFDLPANADLLKIAAKDGAVYFHSIGTPQSADNLVFRQPGPGTWLYTLSTAAASNFLVVETRDGSKNINRVYYKPLNNNKASLKTIFNEEKGNYSFIGSDSDNFYFFTNLDAPNGKIVGVNAVKKQIFDVIKESGDAIAGASQTGGNALGLFDDKFVIMYIHDGQSYIKGFDKTGKYLYSTPLPAGGTVWGNFVGNDRSQEVFFNFLNLTDASTIYKLDASTGKLTLFKCAKTNFDAEKYITERVFYTSADGTRVPMFVTHRKDIKLNGSHPAFIYAYGALNWVSILFYQEHLLVWLEMGGVYAQPGIRGGGEYGEKWHQAGVGHNRQNAINDYIAAAQWLIDNKYTTSAKLIANGGSLSGALAGQVILQRPDLFGGCIIDRSAMDMVRFTKFTNGNTWVGEFGDPENPADFKVLYSLSPYHQVKAGICYPPMLIMTGDRDQVAPPAHAYKFTAALQANNSNCSGLVLLKIMHGVGHNFGNTHEQVVDSRTDEIMFLIKILGLEKEASAIIN